MSTLKNPAWNTLERSVRAAQRRLVLQSFVNIATVALSLALVLILVWVVLQPRLLPTVSTEFRWGLPAGMACLAGLGAGFWAYFHRPSRMTAALEVDARFELRERVATALGLPEIERESSAATALSADAAERLKSLHVSGKFPVRPGRGAAMIPVLIAAVIGATYYPIPLVDELISNVTGTPVGTQAKAEEKKPDPTKATPPQKSKNKADELGARKPKSEELKELEEKFQEMLKKYDNDPNRDQPEKLKEKVAEATNIEEKMKKLAKEKTERLEKMEDRLRQLDRMENEEKEQEGPAQKMKQALAKGDLAKAADEIEGLKKKIKENKLTEEEKHQLTEQLSQMRDKLRRETKERKERKEKLEQMIDQAKKEGKDAESLERELENLKEMDRQSSETTKDLADKFDKAQEAMRQENMEQAAKELSQAANSLGDTQEDLKDLEDLNEQLQRLKEEKKQCNGKCKGKGKGDGKGDGEGDSEEPNNGGIGKGRRGINEKAETNSQEERIRAPFDPKGKKTYGGATKGQGFKKATTAELGKTITDAAQDAPHAADSQRLPREAKDAIRDYFQNLGGQADGGNK